MSRRTPRPSPEFLRRIRMVAFDVDGVLTDGRIWFGKGGDEWKAFHVRDGYAIRVAQRVGLEIAFVTGRTSAAVERRAEELGVSHVIQGSRDKVADFQRLLPDGMLLDQAAFVGDDLPDLPLLRQVGLSACPSDAADEVRREVQYVCRTAGGGGVAREILELILRGCGRWGEELGKRLLT